MKQADYVRMAEECAREAYSMPLGPERTELLRRMKRFELYANIEGWIDSPALQPAS
jgi:hypothetical protein